MIVYRLNNKVAKFNDSWLKESNPHVYPYVRIGTQVWMTDNLTIDDSGDGILIVDGQYYYTFDAAIRVASTVQGWHLPSQAEYETLFAYCGAADTHQPNDIITMLASTTGWTNDKPGTDSFGLNLTPGGYISANGSSPWGVGSSFYLWTSDGPDQYNQSAYLYGTTYPSSYFGYESAGYHYQVRLIRD